MHRMLPIGEQARWWPPRLNPWLVRAVAPLRRWIQRRQYRIDDIAFEGVDRLQSLLDQGHGVLITPNHFAYPDPFLLSVASDQVGQPFYFMTAWQVFGTSNWVTQKALQQLGCFSVDREGTDMRAFRTAVDILQTRTAPLVIFPEGEMYHVGERVMPFQEGAAAIALSAARKASRPISCLPCGLRYYYVEDPGEELEALAGRLEEAFFWRKQPDMPLVHRVLRLAEGAIALKELEQFGATSAGDLKTRLAALLSALLGDLEQRYALDAGDRSVPHRIKQIRHRILKQLRDDSPDNHGSGDDKPASDPPASIDAGSREAARDALHRDLDRAFLATQVFSYPGDYLVERPVVERVAETLDKLEEDILGVQLAPSRSRQKAVATFGEPIEIPRSRDDQPAVEALTNELEEQVGSLVRQLARHTCFPPLPVPPVASPARTTETAP